VKPTDDPRQRTDSKFTKQTDEPGKPVVKEKQGGAWKEDLEKWKDRHALDAGTRKSVFGRNTMKFRQLRRE
jgi:hypothetical protein